MLDFFRLKKENTEKSKYLNAFVYVKNNLALLENKLNKACENYNNIDNEYKNKLDLIAKSQYFEENKIYVSKKFNEKIKKGLLTIKKISEDVADYRGVLKKSYEDFISYIEKSGDFEYKKYMKHNIGRSRSTMPQIDTENLPDLLIHFAEKASITRNKRKLSLFKPSQINIDEDKVLKKMDSGDWKKRGYVISKDNYLIDGHHDWAAGLEFDPNFEVDTYKINIPIKNLLKRCNQLKISYKADNIE